MTALPAKLRHQPGEQLRIDVAAGQHRHHDLAFDVELAAEQRREPDGAAGLDHELELAEGEGDRLPDLLVARGDALAHEPAIDLEGDDRSEEHTSELQSH